MKIQSLENRITRAEAALIVLSIAAIAAADFTVGADTSLGPLYLIPLCYSALSLPPWLTVIVFAACLGLRQAFGPLQQANDPLFTFLRDLLIAAAFVAVAFYLRHLGRQRHEFFELARSQRDELAAEVHLAAHLQARLLQMNVAPTDRLDIYARTAPLKGVGGDYYDFLDLGPDRVGVVIADVAGKGLTAAMLMPAVRIALRSIVQRLVEPRDIVAELDRTLFRATEPENYATLFFASIDLGNGGVECVNAGHLPALLIDPAGTVKWLGTGGPPVGLLPSAHYSSERENLKPGGYLVLYTDGITESLDADGNEYGPERLTSLTGELIGRRSEEVVNAIRRDLLHHIGSGSIADDATAIVVRRQRPHESPGDVATDFVSGEQYRR